MAKQIIVTQNDYGIELETQFVDDKKKPLDITDYDVRVKIIYDDKTIDTILAGHKDSVNGIAYIVLEKEHLINAGLHTSVWSVVDEDEHVTAQENVYYFVKDVEGSEDDTPTTDLPIDADGVLNKFNEIDNNLFELTEQVNVVNEEIDSINEQLDSIEAKEINILEFGAKGDGVNDDTMAFKNAINELSIAWSNSPNTLFIPSGVYRITEPIIINKNNIRIEGAGQDQTIILVDGYINGLEVTGANYLYSVKIGRLSIVGKDKSNKTGMQINNLGLHSHLYDIVIENCGEYGLYITGYSFDFPIDNVHVRNCKKEGIYVEEQKDPFKEISYISFNKCTVVACGTESVDTPQWTISGSDALMLNDCKANQGLIGFNFINNVRGIYINNVYMDGALGETSDGYKAHIFRINDNDGYNFNISNVYGWRIDTVALFLKGGKANIRNVDVICGDDVRNNSIVVGENYKGPITVDWSCTENFNIIDPNNKIIYPMLSTKKRIATKNEANGYIDLGDNIIMMWGNGTSSITGEYVKFPKNITQVYHIDFTSCDNNNLGETTKTEFYVMKPYGDGVYVRSNRDGRSFTYKLIGKK